MSESLLKRIATFFYLLLLFLLPTQLGKHFWPPFSLVGGLRVDYLSPTLYVTDLLILLLAILTLYRFLKTQHKKKQNKNTSFPLFSFPLSKKTLGILLFLLCLITGVVFSKNPPAGIYGIYKVLEMGFFAWYTSRVLGKEISFTTVAFVLSSSVIFESLLTILQFFSKGSIGGLLYFFGERTFTASTPGIANASINGQLILRPYGTLPHPNVLAGFLLIMLLFLSSQWNSFTGKKRWVLLATILLGVFSLFLTLARVPLVLFFLLSALALVLFVKERKKILLPALAGIVAIGGLIGTLIVQRFAESSFLEEAFVQRLDLLQNAWWMVATYPLFGVGLMNFLVRLPSYQHTTNYYHSLQPVHNIFLLFLAETGVICFSLVLYFLLSTLRRVWQAKPSSLKTACLCMLFSVFFLGMFDHYFLTLQQGQLLFAFVIGLCYALAVKEKAQMRYNNAARKQKTGNKSRKGKKKKKL